MVRFHRDAASSRPRTCLLSASVSFGFKIRGEKDDEQRLRSEQAALRDKIKDNVEKIKLNKRLPYLVGNVVEVLDVEPEEEEDGANVDLDSQRKGQCVVLKTSTRQVRHTHQTSVRAVPEDGTVPPRGLPFRSRASPLHTKNATLVLPVSTKQTRDALGLFVDDIFAGGRTGPRR